MVKGGFLMLHIALSKHQRKHTTPHCLIDKMLYFGALVGSFNLFAGNSCGL